MRPRSINGLEFSRVLELMGLTQHYRTGQYRVFVDNQGRRVLSFEERWDMPVQDIEELLSSRGLSAELFWEKYESLYNN